jgi:hypothetical protein
METTRRIGELLRRVRTVVQSNDPAEQAAFFEEKAALFDEIAALNPWQADEATAMAQTARARAAELRSHAPDDEITKLTGWPSEAMLRRYASTTDEDGTS